MTNDLINTQSVETIDSREVAEMIEMRHTDLLRKVASYQQILENAKLRSQEFFIPSEYKVDGNNKTYNCYLLTKKGCEMVANKLTGEKGVLFTAQYVNRFEEMEKAIQSKPPVLPNNYVEALEHLLHQARINEQLVLENNQLRFKLEAKEIEDNRLWTIEEIAKEHNMSARVLNKLLETKKVQYTRKGRWYLYKKYKNKGYAKSVSNWLKWTNEGKLFIEQLLLGE